jgi:hypothetical protein
MISERERFDRAEKVSIEEYDHDYVSTSPWGDEGSYVHTDDVAESDWIACRGWAWACRPTGRPSIDARHAVECAAEEYFEGVICDLDIGGLQETLDKWVSEQGAFDRAFIADPTRVVIFNAGLAGCAEHAADRGEDGEERKQ